MIKGVFFDAIDTIFRPYPDKIGMYQRIIKKVTGLDVDYDKMSIVWKKSIASTEKKAKLEVCEHRSQQAWVGFNSRILQMLGYEGDCDAKGDMIRIESWTNPENFRLYDDVIPTLERLKELDIKIGCISNEVKELNNFFAHFDLNKYFDEVIISDEVGCEKPNKEIYLLGLKQLNLSPNETLFIGDSLISDYEGSKNVGMNSFLIDRDDLVDDNKIDRINSMLEIFVLIERENKNANTVT